MRAGIARADAGVAERKELSFRAATDGENMSGTFAVVEKPHGSVAAGERPSVRPYGDGLRGRPGDKAGWGTLKAYSLKATRRKSL